MLKYLGWRMLGGGGNDAWVGLMVLKKAEGK